jgi:hypothetical protein
MPQEIEKIILFTSFFVMTICGFYSYVYSSDLDVRRTDEFKKAASYLPDVYPNTGAIFSPGTGIILMRLVWYVIKKNGKSKADKRFIVSQILGGLSSIVFMVLLFTL